MSDGFEWRNGLPVKIESWASTEAKSKWLLVSSENYRAVPGQIIAANCDTGECTVSIRPPGAEADETKTLAFGFSGVRIVKR